MAVNGRLWIQVMLLPNEAGYISLSAACVDAIKYNSLRLLIMCTNVDISAKMIGTKLSHNPY